MTDPRGVCARSAETLAPGIPYVRGWSDARRAAEALARQLTGAGLASDVPGLKADVNVIGQGVVPVGTVRPDVCRELARLIAAGLAAEMAQQHNRGTSRAPSPGPFSPAGRTS
ncbi:hypothetical protein OG896_11035 [Streptomyces sp. NBC_00669]|uniref:hypothetical protein n=1 Tax=Streptomyces sp. NBC_00669 TaxID=2976011 RepID=UPI002E2F574D|nr:hypothetical protein [Streptomyces sp. NBC_00669]